MSLWAFGGMVMSSTQEELNEMSGLVKPMTREDMLRKLSGGIDPLDIVIEKWTLLSLWHKEHDDSDNPCKELYDSTTCALCETHLDIKESYQVVRCSQCIVDSYALQCGRSEWSRYNALPSLSNARCMVKLFETIKLEESSK